MGEWISVVDRLPENEQRVLMRHYYQGRVLWIASGGISNGDWWCDFNDENFKAQFYNSVTDWMPLPEPPK